jgi:hypothetical protein
MAGAQGMLQSIENPECADVRTKPGVHLLMQDAYSLGLGRNLNRSICPIGWTEVGRTVAEYSSGLGATTATCLCPWLSSIW